MSIGLVFAALIGAGAGYAATTLLAKKPKPPALPSAPPFPKEADIGSAKATERRRLRRRGTETLFTSNWLQEPGITQMRLGGV